MKFPKPEYPLQLLEIDGKLKVYDIIRKDYFVLTPEEWVRQHVLHLLIKEKDIAKGRIAIERQIKGSKKRFDILVHHSTTGKPQLIIECKSFKEKLKQATLNQIGRYNLKLQVPFLVVTNWHSWIAAEVNQSNQQYSILNQFPDL